MKGLFILILFFLTSFVNGQITYDNLEMLRNMGMGEIEEYLVSRNWNVKQIEEKTDFTGSSISFTLDNKKSIDYLTVTETEYYNEEGKRLNGYNRINLGTSDKILYLSILNRIKNLKFILTKTKIEKDKLKKLYKHNNIAISISINNIIIDELHDPVPFYIIFIANNKDFEMFFEFKEFL